jgi:hypothetical protein
VTVHRHEHGRPGDFESMSKDELKDLIRREAEELGLGDPSLQIAGGDGAPRGNFTGFVEDAWPSIDSTPFMRNWAVDGICEHLQAVTEGHIKRLLINIPFRSGKSAVTTSVCWPAWTWTWAHLVDAR